jgi:hypothetical protein
MGYVSDRSDSPVIPYHIIHLQSEIMTLNPNQNLLLSRIKEGEIFWFERGELNECLIF